MNAVVPFKVCSLPDLIRGANVLCIRDYRPWWLLGAAVGSDEMVQVGLLGTESRTPHTWIGEGGSPCIRATMITAARLGLAAVMVRHFPDQPGWPRGRSALCMTFAYQAHIDRHSDLRASGMPWWQSGPSVERLALYDPARWAGFHADVQQSDDAREHDRERLAALLAFIEDPTRLGGGVLAVTR
jgi:hypothetical protein